MNRSLETNERMDFNDHDDVAPCGEIVFSLQEWGELQQVPLIVADLSGRVLEVLPNGSDELVRLEPWLPGQNLRELPAGRPGIREEISFEQLWEGLLASGMQGDVNIGFCDPQGEAHAVRGTAVVVLRKDQMDETGVCAHVVLALRPSTASSVPTGNRQTADLCLTIRHLVHDINNDLTTCLCELSQMKNQNQNQSAEEFQRRIELMEGLLLEISGKNRKVSSLCKK